MRIFVITALCLGLLTGCFSTADEEKGLIEQVNVLEKEGKWDEVKVKLDDLFKLNPKNVDGFLAQARMYVANDDPKAAINSFNSALENDPKNADAMLGLAKIYLAGKRVGDAQTQIDKLLSQDPKNKEARSLKATALVLGGDMRGADEAFSQILADDPKNIEALLGKFGIAMEEGRTTEAWQLLEQALKDNPDNTMLLERAAILHFRTGKVDLAEQELLHLMELAPDSPQYTMHLLEMYGATKNLDKAEALLRKALQAHPDEDQYRNSLAVLLFNTKRVDEAFSLLKEVKSPSPAVRMTLAQFLLFTGKHDEALATLRTVAEDTSDAEMAKVAKIRLAMLLADNAEIAEAEALVKSVLESDPDNSDALKLQGKLLFVQGKLDEALAALNKAKEKHPEGGDVAIMLFRVYVANNKAAEGTDIMRAFLRKFPNFVPGRMTLGSYYIENNQLDSAKEQLTAALEFAPKDAEIYLLLGDIEAMRGDSAKAKDYFEKAAAEPAGELAGLMRLGNLSLKDNKADAALKYFEKAGKAYPDAPQPAEGKILALMQQKKFKDAYEWAINRAKERSTDSAAQELASRVSLMIANKPNDAEEYLQKSMKLAPDALMPITRMTTFYLQVDRRTDAIKLLRGKIEEFPPLKLTLAQVLGEGKDKAEKDEAEKLYREVLTEEPQNVVANNNLADLLTQRYGGDPAKLTEARELAERAATQGDPIALDTLGWIQHLQGDNDAALISLGKAAHLEPNTPVIIYHYATTLAATGKKDEAKKMLKLLLAKFKNFPERKDAEALLKTL